MTEKFNPIMDVPNTKEQVFKVFEQWGTNHGESGAILKDLFLLYMNQNIKLEEAYEKCLLKLI